MNKLFISTLMLFVFVFAGTAQEKGDKWIGGTLLLSSSESGSTTRSTTTLAPELGFHLGNGWAAGGRIGFTFRKTDGGGGTDKSNTTSIVPFARYYFAEAGRFKFFGQGELPLSFSGGENADGSSKSNNNSIGLRVRPGLSFDFNERWGFNMLMPSVFSFASSSNDNSSVYFGVNDGYNIQDYLLNTSIGFVYKF